MHLRLLFFSVVTTTIALFDDVTTKTWNPETELRKQKWKRKLNAWKKTPSDRFEKKNSNDKKKLIN